MSEPMEPAMIQVRCTCSTPNASTLRALHEPHCYGWYQPQSCQQCTQLRAALAALAEDLHSRSDNIQAYNFHRRATYRDVAAELRRGLNNEEKPT